MARSALAVQSATPAGLNATYTTVSTGTTNGIKHDPRYPLHVKNVTGGNCTITVVTPGAPGGNAIEDKAITQATATERFYDFSESVYRNAADGLVYVDFSAAVTVAAVSL